MSRPKEKKRARTMEDVANWLDDHERADAARFKSIEDRMASLATSDGLQVIVNEIGLLSKKMEPVRGLYDNITLAAKITEGGGKWFARTVLLIASLIVAFGLITGTAKTMLLAVIGWATPR